MKISIIIPVYNVENFIRRCLESVANQVYPNIEVILIDDASPDKSIDIAKEFINTYKYSNIFKIIIHEQNRGLSAARNTGIKIQQAIIYTSLTVMMSYTTKTR